MNKLFEWKNGESLAFYGKRLYICSMKRVITFLVCILMFGFLGMAQGKTHVYQGRYENASDILYTWDGKHLYRGRYTNASDILYTWDGKHLYQGRYTNASDILCTWDGKHVYRGRYTNASDIVATTGGTIPLPLLLQCL